MVKALVIKTYGDESTANAIAGAIIDTSTRRVIQLDEDELASVKAEVARLRDKNGLRAYGDEKRLRTAQEDWQQRYSTKQHGRLYDGIMGLYGLVCLGINGAYCYLSAWNRG